MLEVVYSQFKPVPNFSVVAAEDAFGDDFAAAPAAPAEEVCPLALFH